MQASKASETIHRFQIGNLHGENWKSTYLSPHDEISIAGQLGSTEIWFLEKHATEPLWSFYVSLSENLHVECDEAARGTTNPAQELKNRASKFFETFKAATDKLKLELQQKTSQDNEDHQQQQSTDTIHGSHDETSVSETGLASDIVKKYYVTYNKKSDGDANVTLELPHDNDPSMTRYFYAFYQPSGRLRLQPQSTPGKFLGINNCALAVLNEKEIREEHEWVIDFEVTAGSKQGDVETRVT